jgi:prepilin-type N-terminal cleavage/methylation domain-containing protein
MTHSPSLDTLPDRSQSIRRCDGFTLLELVLVVVVLAIAATSFSSIYVNIAKNTALPIKNAQASTLAHARMAEVQGLYMKKLSSTDEVTMSAFADEETIPGWTKYDRYVCITTVETSPPGTYTCNLGEVNALVDATADYKCITVWVRTAGLGKAACDNTASYDGIARQLFTNLK